MSAASWLMPVGPLLGGLWARASCSAGSCCGAGMQMVSTRCCCCACICPSQHLPYTHVHAGAFQPRRGMGFYSRRRKVKGKAAAPRKAPRPLVVEAAALPDVRGAWGEHAVRLRRCRALLDAAAALAAAIRHPTLHAPARRTRFDALILLVTTLLLQTWLWRRACWRRGASTLKTMRRAARQRRPRRRRVPSWRAWWPSTAARWWRHRGRRCGQSGDGTAARLHGRHSTCRHGNCRRITTAHLSTTR